MITADQILCHFIGDYILQSDWMANNKTKRTVAALAHVSTYCLPFLFLRPSLLAFVVIVGTHFIIDRWRLARYVVWVKNWMGPNLPWSECIGTGYPPTTPIWMSVWLMIIADNIMHILINGLALKYL